MDSYNCLVAPCPKQRPMLQPTVPDVSLLMPTPSTNTNTYNEWKNKFQNMEQRMNPTVSILKKQVRFNSPNGSSQHYGQLQATSSHSDYTNANMDSAQCSTQCSTPPMNKVFKTKQFQDIYMANIPNRQLDLSLLVKPINKPQELIVQKQVKPIEENSICDSNNIPPASEKVPTTYKEFLEMQEKQNSKLNKQEKCTDGYITDIFNYTSPRNGHIKKRSYKNSRNETEDSNKSITTQKQRVSVSEKINSQKNTYSTANLDMPSDISHRKATEGQKTSYERCIYDNTVPSPQCETEKYLTKFNQIVSNNTKPPVSTKEKSDSAIQTSFTSIENNDQNIEKASSSSKELARQDEPTVKDLLKIIQQQNEQLLVLQKQVASLLDCRERPKQIEAPSQNYNYGSDNKFIHNREQRGDASSAGSTPRKGPMPKFSIDMMTSFEVSFRPQQNLFPRKQRDFITQEPKIQEITETDSTDVGYSGQREKRTTDTSLHLEESINVRETCPSPEPSIKINMKEYESSEDDEDEGASILGATFYQNLMDQVNKIIQNAQVESNIDGWPLKTGDMRDKTLNRVKDTTIKHLKKIGYNFSTINEVSTSYKSDDNNDNCASEQISFAVKQLLMKYLPDDQLARLNKEKPPIVRKKNTTEKIILDSRAPEFSFATVQFMKKYNLIAGETGKMTKKNTVPAKILQNKILKGLNENNPRILDISALKQQPKLL